LGEIRGGGAREIRGGGARSGRDKRGRSKGGQTMKVYTYSEARQGLALLLEEAWNNGGGRAEKSTSSPLDVVGVNLGLTTEEIVSFVHEGRRGTVSL
jgi:hypothetical protein